MPRKPRLNKQQYFELDSQFARTPPLSEGTSASGEHYQLVYLLSTFGFRNLSRERAMELTEQLLADGYRDE